MMKTRRIAILVVGVALAVVCAAEVAARTAVDQQLHGRVPPGIQVQLAGLALPSLVTGSLPVRAEIDAQGLTELGNLGQVRIEDTIQISTQRETKLGSVPVVVNLTPGINAGQLTFSLISASAAGVELPAKQQAKLAARLTAPTLSWRCLHATTAIVQNHHLVVTGTVAVHPDGSSPCR